MDLNKRFFEYGSTNQLKTDLMVVDLIQQAR